MKLVLAINNKAVTAMRFRVHLAGCQHTRLLKPAFCRPISGMDDPQVLDAKALDYPVGLAPCVVNALVKGATVEAK